MSKYVIRRLMQAVPLVLLVTIIVFFLLKTAGDPLAYLANDPSITEQDRLIARARFGLDDPLPLQFVHWLIGDDWYERDIDGDGEPDQYGDRKGILRGDLGQSIAYRRPVTEVIAQFLPNTLLLGLTSYAVVIATSFALGIFAALRQYSMADNVITAGAFLTYSIPSFLMALILVQIFAIEFKNAGLPSLPVSNMYDARGDHSFDELIRHMILPVASLSLIRIAGYSRYIRATMLEVINTDYIRTARAKGLMERRIIYLHALKNASLPIITLIGLNLPFVLGGAIITETIFAWPGMGRMYINALNNFDASLMVIFVLMTAVSVVLFQLLTDLTYAAFDPRIRYD
jgi:peptide/nickel transport system permease protein